MLTRSLAKLRICSPLIRMPALSTIHSKSQGVHLLELPREVFHHLLSFLPLPVCGQLCLTSRSVREEVLTWVSSRTFSTQATAMLLKESDAEVKFNKWLQLCRYFGFFCKCLDMTESPSVRVMRLVCLFQQLEEIGCAELASTWAEVQGKAGFAAALHALTQGWHNSELEKVFNLVEVQFDALCFLRNTNVVVRFMSWNTENPEAQKLRLALRSLFWDFHVDDSSKAAWLGFLLRKFSREGLQTQQGNFTAHGLQANLLFFMLGSSLPMAQLGPGHGEFEERMLAKMKSTPDHQVVQWQPLAQSYAQARLHFGDLGKAFRVLETFKEVAGQGGLYRLMATMFLGGGWAIDNTAACLLFSSEAVVKKFLEGLAKVEKQTPVQRVAEAMVSLILVCEALGNGLNRGLLRIVDFTFNRLSQSEKQKKALVHSFWSQLVHRLEFDDHNLNQGTLGLDVLVELGSHLGRRAYPTDVDMRTRGMTRGKRQVKGVRRRSFIEIEE